MPLPHHSTVPQAICQQYRFENDDRTASNRNHQVQHMHRFHISSAYPEELRLQHSFPPREEKPVVITLIPSNGRLSQEDSSFSQKGEPYPLMRFLQEELLPPLHSPPLLPVLGLNTFRWGISLHCFPRSVRSAHFVGLPLLKLKCTACGCWTMMRRPLVL